jgi:hypothetical protein
MLSKRYTTYIIIFNAIILFFLFMSCQLILTALNGKIVKGAGIFIESSFPYSPNATPIPTVTAPLPNYPLLVFIFALIINALFFIKIRKSED